MTHDITALDVPKNPAERRAWVVYQLHIRGKSIRRLAREEGVAQQTLSAALMTPNSHLEPVLAHAIGLNVPDLFPERFRGGERISPTRATQRTRGERPSQRQKGAAA